MKWTSKIYQWATYFFIGFFILLIVVAFGMPDFIGTSGTSDRYIAAKIGKEVVTRKEVAFFRDDLIRRSFQGQAVPENLKGYFFSQGLERAINYKVFLILSRESGLYPTRSMTNKIVANYLKKNYSQYNTENGFDLIKFKSEVLQNYRISLIDIEKQAIWQYALGKNEQLFSAMATINQRELEDKVLLSKTRVALDILVIKSDDKKRIFMNTMKITEKDIQEKFKKDYLSKNKADKLTKLKREAIKESIYKTKEQQVEQTFNKEINQLKDSSIAKLYSKYKGSKISIPSYTLDKKLSEVSKNKLVNLTLLETSKLFLNNLISAETNKVIGPIADGDNIYFFTVKSRNIPTAALVTKEAKKINDTEKKAAEQEHFNIIYNEVFNIVRNEHPVRKFALQN